jgi:hypothetical protein
LSRPAEGAQAAAADSLIVVSVMVWLCKSHGPWAYGEISPYE